MTITPVKITELCEVIAGGTPDTSDARFWGGDICWATPKDLSELDGPEIVDTPRKLTKAGLDSSSASVLPPGSVLFSSRAPIGLVAINRVPMATNQGFKSFVPRPGKVDSSYLYHWLRANRPRLEALGNGATFKEVSKSVVERIELPVPWPDDSRRSLAEQKRIAAILEKADALRRNRREGPDLCRDLVVSTFVDRFGDPVKNNLGLPTRPLIELVDPDRPITYGILMPGPDMHGGVPYVRVAEMKNDRIDLGAIRRTTPEMHRQYIRSELRAGDLLMSIRGHVGRLAIVPTELEGGNITQDTARLAIPDKNLTIFVFWLLDTPPMQHWMARHTKGVAVRGINLGDVKQMPILMPAPDRIADFAQFARATFEMQSAQIRAAAEAGDLFNALVQRAFRGEL